MADDDLNPKRRRIVVAPSPTHPRLRSTVLNVECDEDEEVQWIWTETADGRFVSGYRILPRLHKLAG